jgi:predicted metal-binding protein
MDIKKIEQMGMEQGFSHVVLLDCDTIELKPEVRQMCAADTCHKYDKCWSCPPGCGSLEECEAKVRQYKYGIIVQTVGELEDVFDGEGMMETEARHKEYFVEFRLSVLIQREMWREIMVLSQASITATMFLFSTLEIPHVQTRTIYCILLINTWICIWKIRATFRRKQKLRNTLKSQQKQ